MPQSGSIDLGMTFGAGSATLPFSIANGGTGQTTAGAAFNALSPITTAGDLIIGNGANSATRLGIGTTAYTLVSNGTTAAWGVLGIAGGGSGQVTANAALNAFLPAQGASAGLFLKTDGANTSWAAAGSGTVTSVSVVSANGLAGSVATATTTPAITLSVSITGVLKGNGTAISAATVGTDYSVGTSALATGLLKSTTATGALSIAVSGVDYGDVVGPSSATDNAVARFDGTTGKLLQDTTPVTIGDGGALSQDCTADAVQHLIQGHSTQTNLLSRWENSSATLLASVSGAGFIGVGPNVPKASLHVGPSTTSGTVGTNAVILGKIDTTANMGAGSVLIGGNANPNSCAGSDSLVGGRDCSLVSTAAFSLILGRNCTQDSRNGPSWVGGEDCRARGTHNFVYGYQAETGFDANYAFSIGRGGASAAAGASILSDGLGNMVTNSLANSFLSRFSGGWRRVKTSLTTGPIEQVVQDTVATTDATVTTLQSYTTATDTTYLVSAMVSARRTGGAAGAAGDSAGYVLQAVVKNVAGTVTVNGLLPLFSYEDQVLMDATIDASGTTFRVRVTGTASNNFTWNTTTTMTIL